MSKSLLALGVVALFAISDARADFGTAPRPGVPAGASGGTPGQYGWNPIMKRIFFWRKSDDCGTCNTGKCGPGGCAPQAAAAPMPGTLVFPTHMYNRSPRDYFMYGQGGN